MILCMYFTFYVLVNNTSFDLYIEMEANIILMSLEELCAIDFPYIVSTGPWPAVASSASFDLYVLGWTSIQSPCYDFYVLCCDLFVPGYDL